MAKYKPLTEQEIDAARQYINKSVRFVLAFNPADGWVQRLHELHDMYPCCPHDDEITVKHQQSLQHVAYRNNMSVAHLRRVVKTVKVMDALEGKTPESSQWKRV